MNLDCRTGNCHLKPQLWAQTKFDVSDLQIEDSTHPNVMPFNGTLLLLDEASDQPPHGAEGHLIRVSKKVAKNRLGTLPGMAINYASDLTGHNPAKKVGVITEASITGGKVRVKGLVWKKDFPEAARVFKQNRGRLGMSMELGDVYVQDKDARVWDLEDFHFTGATVLLKDHAAYGGTDLAASKHFVKALAAAAAVRGIFRKGGKPEMADKSKDKKDNGQSQGQVLVSAISAAVEKGVSKSLESILTAQKESNEKVFKALENISASNEELAKGLHELVINAAAGNTEVDDDVEADETDDVSAAKADATDATDATDDASDGTDATDDATMEAADATGTDSLDPTNVDSTSQDDTGSGSNPGDLNPNATPYAKRNARSGAGKQSPGGKSISKGIAASKREDRNVGNISAAAKVIRTLRSQVEDARADNQKLRNRVKAMEASMERYADRVERKSITPEISALLEKAGWDVRELMASKQRLSVNDVDEMLSKSGVSLEPTMRAAFKNQLLQAGLMDQGQVNRYN